MKKIIILIASLLIPIMFYSQTNDGSAGTQDGRFLKKDFGDSYFVRYKVENSNSNGYAGVLFIADDDTVFMQVDTLGKLVISPFFSDSITVSADGDTLRLNPGAELNIIDIEVGDDRKFAVDSTGLITLEEGGTFDNNTNNTFEWNENSDELIWTFGSNVVTASSGDVTIFDYGALNVQGSTYNFATAAMVTGTGDSIVVDFTPDLTLAAGLMITFVAESANTGAAELTVDGVVKDLYESSDISALEANDIRSGSTVQVIYDGTQFQQISQSGN